MIPPQGDFSTRTRGEENGSGGALAVWQQDDGGSDGYDVYGRRLDDAGQPLAAPFAILHADADQQAPAVAGNGDGDYLTTWQDNYNGGWDIYAALFRPLQAGFSATPTAGSAPLRVAFADASTPAGAADQWRWTFGDGGQAAHQPTPVHTYTQAGVYTVTQRVTHTVTGEWDVLTRTHYVTVSAAAAPDLVTTTITYTYDGLYRLSGADYSSGENFQYQYDATGNRTVYTATVGGTQVTTYTYDAANRLITITNGGNVRTLEWSAVGKLLRDGDDTYAWNAAGRLVSATVDGVVSRYAYLGDGGRISMTVDSETTTYTLDLAAPLVQVLTANGDEESTAYLYGATRIGEYDDVWRYYLADHLGSVRSLVGADGSVEGTQAYRPYGASLNTAGTPNSIYGFTGEQTDSTGLIYLRARVYAPWLGQFASRDLLRGLAKKPQSHNLYTYAYNNPINSVDPTGMVPQPGTRFSCRCGWIDWGHCSPRTARTIKDRIRTEVVGGDPDYKAISTGLVSVFPPINQIAVVSKQLSHQEQKEVALGIYMSLEEHVENWQSTIESWWGWQEISTSGYALEDLSNDLIGFYVAWETEGGVSQTDLERKVDEKCHLLNAQDSLSIYNAFEKAGLLYKKNYQWMPYEIPGSCSEVHNLIADKCGDDTSWPSEYSNVTPEPEQRNGKWWWIQMGPYGTDGTIRPTGNIGVYEYSLFDPVLFSIIIGMYPR